MRILKANNVLTLIIGPWGVNGRQVALPRGLCELFHQSVQRCSQTSRTFGEQMLKLRAIFVGVGDGAVVYDSAVIHDDHAIGQCQR